MPTKTPSQTPPITIHHPSQTPPSPLKPRQLRRFYEPVVLCKALTNISLEHNSLRPSLPITPSPSPSPSPSPQTPQDRFRRFLDRLAAACDREKGGATVTALAVVDTEEAFVYVFGCNNVGEAALRETAAFVARLLGLVEGFDGLAGEEEKEVVRGSVLEELVVFNRGRIEKYVGFLRRDLDDCIRSCGDERNDSPPMLQPSLTRLRDAISSDQQDYLPSTLSCFAHIHTFLDSTPSHLIDSLADHARLLPGHTTMECWSELRHHLTRLLSYERSVSVFTAASSEWPDLFRPETVRIWALSSPPASRKPPLGGKSSSAVAIIGRMTSDSSVSRRYAALAEAMQREPLSLDDRIRSQCRNVSFRPRVHGEVAVFDFLLRTFSPRPPFFNGWRYVGTSKGTCKLCAHYFSAHPSRVAARPSHGNLYAGWAFPDVRPAEDGEGAERRRQGVFDELVKRVRADAFEILEERSATGKRHDSNTYALAEGGRGSQVDELVGRLEDMGFGNTSGSLSDSDHEEGGATLS